MIEFLRENSSQIKQRWNRSSGIHGSHHRAILDDGNHLAFPFARPGGA